MQAKVGGALAGLIAAFLIIPANAQQISVLLNGDEPARCSDAASLAIRTGAAPDAAIALCSLAIERSPMSERKLAATYLNRGVLYLTRANYPAAISDDDHALAMDGGMVEALVNRGAAHAGLHQPKQAAADYSAALALGPAQPSTVYFNRALAREDLGDLKGAYQDYRRAADLAPGWTAPRQELARFTVAKPGQG